MAQLVREVNKLVVLPEQYQLLVNLQLEVEVDKRELLPLVLRQYHHTKDPQVKQNYLVCFDQPTQHSMHALFAAALPPGLDSLLDFSS